MAGSTSPVELLGKLAVGDGTVVTKMIVASASVASDASSVAASIAGVLTTDKVIATINGGNTSSRSILSAVPTANTVTVTLSGTAGAATPITILVLRTE